MRFSFITKLFIYLTVLSAYIALFPIPGVFSNDKFERLYFASTDWVDLVGERTQIGNFDLYSIGTNSNSSNVYIWGDSHAEQYFPRVNYLHEYNDHISATFIRQRGCPPIIDLQHDNEIINYRYRKCDAALLDLLQQSRFLPDNKALVASFCLACLLIPNNDNQDLIQSEFPFFSVNGKRVNLFSEPGRMQFKSQFIDLLLRLGKNSEQIFVLLDNPIGDHFNPLNFQYAGQKTVAVSAEQVDLYNSLYDSISAEVSILAIDVMADLCNEEYMCVREHLDGIPIYKDSDHLNASFIRDYAVWLDQVFF